MDYNLDHVQFNIKVEWGVIYDYTSQGIFYSGI